MHVKAVLFDVDFTLAKPGRHLGPDPYRRIGREFGLDPERSTEAWAAATRGFPRDPELRHDEELWHALSERVFREMGGEPDLARNLAATLTRLWEDSANFDLYDDALPVMAKLREHRLKLGLVSNTHRDIDDFVEHHRLEVDCALSSRRHGWIKPHESIFRAALSLLDVEPAEAVMVGDSIEEDLEGARALGMHAFLIDRGGRHPELAEVLPDLWALPAALGLD